MEQGFEFRGELFAHLHVDSLRTLATAIWLGFERDPRAFIQRRETRALQGRDVQKYVFATIVRRDEAEPPRVIEEFDRSGLTHGTLLSPFQIVRVRMARESSGESRNRGKKSRLL